MIFLHIRELMFDDRTNGFRYFAHALDMLLNILLCVVLACYDTVTDTVP